MTLQPRHINPVELERIKTVKANLSRAEITTVELAEHFHTTRSNISYTFTGRYTKETADTWLTQFEYYLSTLLGVRYVQPYFNDLPTDYK